MIEKTLTVTPKLGLHARPAAMFVQATAGFKSSIMVKKEGVEINGKSVMGLMLLAAECGSKLVIRANGPAERQAIEALETLFARRFDED